MLARSLPAWCVLAYVSVREKKPHVGEHRNVLVVRNLRIIRKYDANRYDRVPTVSQKSVQYSYMYCTGGDGHECIRVLRIRLCVLWMEIRVFFGCKISYCCQSLFFIIIIFLKGLFCHNIPWFLENFFCQNVFFGETVSLNVSIPG